MIICNNDVSIADPWFFRRLRALDTSAYSVNAPTIISVMTGQDQNPFLVRSAGLVKRSKRRVYDAD